MVEVSLQDQLKNVQLQKNYTGLAYDFLNQGTFPGHFSDQLTETRLYLKGFFDALSATEKSLQDQLEPIKSSQEAPKEAEVVVGHPQSV
jgi:hypothetical protein